MQLMLQRRQISYCFSPQPRTDSTQAPSTRLWVLPLNSSTGVTAPISTGRFLKACSKHSCGVVCASLLTSNSWRAQGYKVETSETMQVVGQLKQFYTIIIIISSRCYCSEEHRNVRFSTSSLALPQFNRGWFLSWSQCDLQVCFWTPQGIRRAKKVISLFFYISLLV